MSIYLRMMVLAVAASLATAALAGDAYYQVPVRELKLVEGSLPTKSEKQDWRTLMRSQAMQSYAVLEGQGEAYVVDRGDASDPWFSSTGPALPATADGGTRVLVRAPQGKDVAGHLFLRNPNMKGMVRLKFTIPASAATAEAKQAFYQGKIAYYEILLGRNIPGGAWFRHQVRTAKAELNLKPADQPVAGARRRPGRGDDLAGTYDLFTGGRAMSENLQLDRALPPLRADEKPVKIDSLTGITIQEIDWKPLIKDAKPKLDPLAAKIPADQHVVFFPSFQAAIAVSDETNQHDTPVLRLAQPRSENTRVIERYQQQLGLSVSTLARLLGPTFAKSIALTGSDPFYPMGTDLAVLFESPQPSVLENLLLGRIALAAAMVRDAKPMQGAIDGLKYRGFCTADRSLSSYVAQWDDAVVVTNSLYQLGRLAAVRKGQSKSIAESPEYVFFRIRYPLNDPEETAMAFLSDSTIRRWCGPRWRIADSRRTRAAAVLAELQTSQLDALVRKAVKPGPIYTDLPVLGGGELTVTSAGVASSTFGSLAFMTPIGEIPLDEVTQAEADAYRTWRDGYERNWNWAFDPIALRISLGKQRVAADMTVMPLIFGTEYRQFLSITEGGKFEPTAGDPHDTLSHMILALNRDAPMIRSAENIVATVNQAVSLGWLGQWVSIFVEDDPFWNDLAKVKEDESNKFIEKNVGRLPVAVRIDVSNPLKLAAFLTGARAYIEQSAPGLTHWESLKYKDQSYVRITPAKGRQTGLDNLSIYYTPIGNALTITLSEKILKATIDRALAAAHGKPVAKQPKPWLGTNVALRVDRRILDVANAVNRQQYQYAMQTQCWGNLPILNQWKRLYPDRNPVGVHRAVWGVELVCPGGGKYVWNEKYETMESTVYGHPRRAEGRSCRPARAEQFYDRKLRSDVRESGSPCPSGAGTSRDHTEDGEVNPSC